MYKLFLKRLIDIFISLLLIVALMPILIIVSILLIAKYRSNPFFTQVRPGYKEVAFHIIKFKTMTNEKNDKGELLPDNIRMTPLGKQLRKWSIDELPQLLNVLKGDMSLIGPRPLLFKYIPLYNENQRKRHLVKPGITGLAQVSGRNTIPWSKKFELDTYYAENVSFILDFKILALTVLKVIKKEGINQSNERPMQPFNGLN